MCRKVIITLVIINCKKSSGTVGISLENYITFEEEIIGL